MQGWVLLCLLSVAARSVLAGSPLNVYTSCVTPDGVQGQCRSDPRVQASTAADAGAAALELPIDMRLPCTDANRTCAENVDVAEVPSRVPAGEHIASCSVTLMPWSPFPCSFNTEAFKGVEGQNRTDWCFSSHTKPQTEEFKYADSLSTDGYTNLYVGRLPEEPCGACSSSSSSDDMVASPGYGRHFAKVLLTLSFRVAAGRQFDRTYWFQIGDAVAALGTCTEPTRWLGTDKWWSTAVDITHLQPYLATPGLHTRMSLANLLSNTYNVPLWAQATIQYFWKEPAPTPSSPVSSGSSSSSQQPPQPTAAAAAAGPAHADGGAAAATDATAVPAAAAAAGAAAVAEAWGSHDARPDAAAFLDASSAAAVGAMQVDGQPGSSSSSSSTSGAAGDSNSSGQRQQHTAAAAAAVPDEVIPLVSRAGAAEGVTVLVGDGGSSWPRATFALPPRLSEPGNIYRAQLLVTPKADACEEFWAMNPSGAATNSSCGGLTTGEPYREVRVFVDGQLAGFSPIYYTMYTGGVDPRLWSAIVASYTYSLPTYTFDLSPWLPQLNTAPHPSSSGDSSSIAGSVSSSSGDSSSSSAGSSRDGRLPSMLATQPAPSRRLTQGTSGAPDPQPQQPPSQQQQQQPSPQHQPQQQQQQQQPDTVPGPGTPSSSREGHHTITVELGGATGNGWVTASSLLLWRAAAVGPGGQPEPVSGQQRVEVGVSAGFDTPMESKCVPQPGAGGLSVAGTCTLEFGDRSFEASSILQWRGREWVARVRYATARYSSTVSYSNDVTVTDGALGWAQETQHTAAWSVAQQQEQRQEQEPSTAGGVGGVGRAGSLSGQSQQQQQEEQGMERGARVLTQSAVQFDWLNAGNVAAGGVFEYSFNTTLLQPTVFAATGGSSSGSSDGGLLAAAQAEGTVAARGREEGLLHGVGEGWGEATHVVSGEQRHYQRAVMLNVYNPQSPKCVVPANATHTVTLHSTARRGSSNISGRSRREEETCVRRAGTCGFCGAWLMSNVVEWDDAQRC